MEEQYGVKITSYEPPGFYLALALYLTSYESWNLTFDICKRRAWKTFSRSFPAVMLYDCVFHNRISSQQNSKIRDQIPDFLQPDLPIICLSICLPVCLYHILKSSILIYFFYYFPLFQSFFFPFSDHLLFILLHFFLPSAALWLQIANCTLHKGFMCTTTFSTVLINSGENKKISQATESLQQWGLQNYFLQI